MSLLDYHCLAMSAFFTLDRDGQIPTPYPSSTFTVPQCQFALRAITLTMIHVGTLPLSASLPQAPCQNSRVQEASVPCDEAGCATAHRQRFWHNASHRQRFWHAACIDRRPVHTILRFSCMVCERQGKFTARCWPQLLMWARCHTAVR